ncbi:transglycosylase domain-containing protein [Hymenobacter sp. B81]|uniref:transglycosylase domain-containing protein n=1 Tax=Hymenobacter sp. B81 TaxID=3344878 RepID=UPI0037DC3A7C
MNPKTKKILFWTLGSLGLLLLLGLGVFLLKREELLQYALRVTKQKVERRYPVTLTLGPARFTDLNSVQVEGLSLVPTTPGADTLLTARSLNASISLRSLFARRPVFSNLQIERARLTARKTAAGDNYGFLLKKRGAAAAVVRDTTQGTNYGLLANQLLEAAFDNLPEEADFRDFLVVYDGPRHQARLTMPRFSIEDGDIEGQLTVILDSVSNQIGLRGHVEAGDYEAQLEVFAAQRRPVVLPYVLRRYGARVQFDTLRLSLTGKDSDKDNLTVRGAASASNFVVNHPKLATADIVVRRGGLDFVATLGQNYASLDKGSKITLNRMELYPQLSVRLRPELRRTPPDALPTAKPYTGRLAGLQVALQVESAETRTTDFFASLPEGMFETVEGMQGTGTLQYRLSAALDMQQIDSLRFDSGLKKSKDFSITRFGKVDLRKLNTEFDYTAYNDRGDSLKTFAVGPSNPDFVPFSQVSDYLKYAIITAEDPRFFTHKGFMEKAFVKSAIQNIKEKRFARGGSTLSMQLVKNVFLTREKVVARKVEEALIVWLIENTRLVSKQRMMEVYLNIIEWGPSRYRWPSGERGVYGVMEAARFYYGKEPAELNLQESLYLASIIPKPRQARGSFDAYGDLRRSTRYFFRLIADIMAARGYIPESEADGLSRSVSLTGPARQFMNFQARPDTTRVAAPDSSQFEPINLIDLLNTGGAPDEGVNTTAPRQDEEPAQRPK